MKIAQKYNFVLLSVILGFAILIAAIAAGLDRQLVIIAVAAVAAYTLFWLIYSRRELLQPLEYFTRFAERLTGREQIAPLHWRKSRVEEIEELRKALNLLRDYQLDMENKLRQSYIREQDQKKETMHRARLKNQLMVYYLNDLIAPVSLLGGASELLRSEGGESDAKWADFFTHHLARIRVMSRHMFELGDLGLQSSSFERRRQEVFRTGDLMQNLFDGNRFALHERGVKLINLMTGKTPEKLRADRENLQQLLMIMIRAIGRICGSGEEVCYLCEDDGQKVVFSVRDRRKSDRTLVIPRAGASGPGNADFSSLGMELVFLYASTVGGTAAMDSDADSRNILTLSFDRAAVLPDDPDHADTKLEYSPVFSRMRHASGVRKRAEKFKISLQVPNPDQAEILRGLFLLHGHELTSPEECDIVFFGLPLPPRPEIPPNAKSVFLLGGNIGGATLAELNKGNFHQLPLSTDYSLIPSLLTTGHAPVKTGKKQN